MVFIVENCIYSQSHIVRIQFLVLKLLGASVGGWGLDLPEIEIPSDSFDETRRVFLLYGE